MKNQNLIINILKGGQMTNEKNDGPENFCCKCTRKADHFWEEESYCFSHFADEMAKKYAKDHLPLKTECEKKQTDIDRFIKNYFSFLKSENTNMDSIKDLYQDAFNQIRTSVQPENPLPEPLQGGKVYSYHDPVNHPKHYTKNGIEVIDFIDAYEFGFRLGNAVKYIARAGEKDPAKRIEDLKKARWYLDREIAKHDSK